MTHYVTGPVIRALREARGLTQRQLGEVLCVSDKAVSKWETGRGLPDSTVLEPLAQALGVSLTELLRGEPIRNSNRSANLLRGHFYRCPICGNVLYASGEGAFSCCGLSLPPLETEPGDRAHALLTEPVEDEWYFQLPDHPMTREHHIVFLAFVSSDRVQLQRLYPEQEAAGRFARVGAGIFYACCNRHGLVSLSWNGRGNVSK